MIDMTLAPDSKTPAWHQRLSFVVAFAAWALAMAINGAIPFVTLPTLGQVVWTMGFAQSLAAQVPWALHAIHFGAPEPAAIAFGLAGAFPASLLLRLGFHTGDAYALVACGWLTVAFLGASRMACALGADSIRAALAALCWLGMPMIWMHSGYSMLSFGMALLPAYYLTTWQLASHVTARTVAAYLAACIVAVFMDGYTFMMFATATFAHLAMAMAHGPWRRTLAWSTFPVGVGGLVVAYVLYSLYIGKGQFDAAPIEIFRAFGADLSYFVIPTTGIQWLPDLIGATTDRRAASLFGDYSVWTTTFILPILAVAMIAFVTNYKRQRKALVFALLAFGGLYMSLGPSLKVSSVMDPPGASRATPALMPAAQAVMPTGTAILDGHVPGVKNMRASYRWLALGLLGMWLLMVLAMASRHDGNRHGAWTFACLMVIAFNLPHLGRLWRDGVLYRQTLKTIDQATDSTLGLTLKQGETVAFLPFNNDFLANYVAARLRIRALNVGGDKNLASAQAHWPFRMKQFQQGAVDDLFVDRVAAQLASGEVQAVVVPYVDMLWAAHFWPCPAVLAAHGSSYLKVHADEAPGDCPDQIRKAMAPAIEQLQRDKTISVRQTPFYAIVRLAQPSRNPTDDFLTSVRRAVAFPATMSRGNAAVTWLLGPGWYAAEADHVWSGPAAALSLPLPADCRLDNCQFVLSVQAFGASPQHPMTIRFIEGARKLPLTCFVAESVDRRNISIPIMQPLSAVSIDIKGARSPASAALGDDARVLGIALYSIGVSRDATPTTAGSGCGRET